MARLVLALLMVLTIVPGPTPAGGHTLTGTVNVTSSRLPVGPLEPGRRVIIFGRVKGTDATCWAGQPVELVRVDPGGSEKILAKDYVEGQGRYWFIRRPRRALQVYVRFPGLDAISSEHSHVCSGGASKVVSLPVKRRG